MCTRIRTYGERWRDQVVRMSQDRLGVLAQGRRSRIYFLADHFPGLSFFQTSEAEANCVRNPENV